MINNDILNIKDSETEKEYCHRICMLKDSLGLTWDEVKDILNDNLGLSLTAKGYEWREKHYKPDDTKLADTSPINKDDIVGLIAELKKEKVKLADERTQNNAIIRRISREETIKEIAHDLASQLSKSQLKLPNPSKIKSKNNAKEAILLLSDWHYGIDIDNYYNKYNTDVAKQRLSNLLESVKSYVAEYKLNKLHIINLGDLISGRIHLEIRINNRIDVISQVMEVSEMLAQFLSELSKICQIDFYNTGDNHSRLEPNLKDSLDLETLVRIIPWFLKERLANNKNISIKDNKFSDDIVTFKVLGHNVVAVHGDKDKPAKVINNMTMLTKEQYDLVCTAHLHHWSGDEQNFVRRIGNGSLMGTDGFAEKYRLTSTPSQTMIIVSKENVTDTIKIINVD